MDSTASRFNTLDINVHVTATFGAAKAANAVPTNDPVALDIPQLAVIVKTLARLPAKLGSLVISVPSTLAKLQKNLAPPIRRDSPTTS